MIYLETTTQQKMSKLKRVGIRLEKLSFRDSLFADPVTEFRILSSSTTVDKLFIGEVEADFIYWELTECLQSTA